MAAIDYYFLADDGSSFKVTKMHAPYFYVSVKVDKELEVETFLRKRFERELADIELVEREDLDLNNHLAGLKRVYLKIFFRSVADLLAVRKVLQVHVRRNKAAARARVKRASATVRSGDAAAYANEYLESITDLREFDVKYHIRCAIDTGQCAGGDTLAQQERGGFRFGAFFGRARLAALRFCGRA